MSTQQTAYSPSSLTGQRTTYRRAGLRVAEKLNWLMLSEISWEKRSQQGEEKAQTTGDQASSSSTRKYELVQRTTHKGKPSAADGGHSISSVDICCIINKTTMAKRNRSSSSSSASSAPHRRPRRFLVLVSQFRPPVDCFTLEMPAGLYDAKDENVGEVMDQIVASALSRHASNNDSDHSDVSGLVAAEQQALNASSSSPPPSRLLPPIDGPTFAAARELFEETGYVAIPHVLLWHDNHQEEEGGEKGDKIETGIDGVDTTATSFTCCSSSVQCYSGNASASSYGPLCYDPGLSDDLFKLVNFEINVSDDDDDEDDDGTEDKGDNAAKPNAVNSLLSSLTRRMGRINKKPQQHLDEGEDVAVHLLALDDSDEDDNDDKGGAGGNARPKTTTILQRLEHIRRSVDESIGLGVNNTAAALSPQQPSQLKRTIVDGKLQTMVLGLALGAARRK